MASRRLLVKTGIGDLDDKLGGGYSKGTVNIIGAASSVGKSTFLLNLAETMSDNDIDVVYCTMDMTTERIIAKQASKASVDYEGCHSISVDELFTQAESDEFSGLYEYTAHKNRNVVIFEGMDAGKRDGTKRRLTITDICKFFENYCKKAEKHCVLVVDFLQHIPFDTDNQDMEIGANGDEVKMDSLFRLRNRLDCTIFVVSSVTKTASINASAEINDLCGTTLIGYDADTILLLNRIGGNENIAEISLTMAKNRYGKSGRATCTFDMLHNYFPCKQQL